jgi:hypothetical protein
VHLVRGVITQAPPGTAGWVLDTKPIIGGRA